MLVWEGRGSCAGPPLPARVSPARQQGDRSTPKTKHSSLFSFSFIPSAHPNNTLLTMTDTHLEVQGDRVLVSSPTTPTEAHPLTR